MRMQRTGHLPALSGTFLTRISTTAAVIMIVLAAFTRAFLTNPGTQCAKFLHEFSGMVIGTRHPRGGHPADICAIPIHLDATRHHLHIILLQTRGSTMFTLLGTSLTRLNAALIFVMHDRSVWMFCRNDRSE